MFESFLVVKQQRAILLAQGRRERLHRFARHLVEHLVERARGELLEHFGRHVREFRRDDLRHLHDGVFSRFDLLDIVGREVLVEPRITDGVFELLQGDHADLLVGDGKLRIEWVIEGVGSVQPNGIVFELEKRPSLLVEHAIAIELRGHPRVLELDGARTVGPFQPWRRQHLKEFLHPLVSHSLAHLR